MKKQTNNAVQNKVNLQALKESDERFRSIVLWSPDAIIVTDAEGKIEYMNPAAEKVFNRKLESFAGKDFGLAVVNGGSTEIDIFRPGKDPGVGDMYVVETEWLGEKAHLITIRDITDRKLTEDKLRESEAKYRWVVDNMADVITVMDMNLRFTYVSPSIMRMRGYTAEEAVAQTFEQVMTPESLQIIAKVFEEEMNLEASGTADPGRIRILELEQYRKDGSIVCMENSLSFMRDEAQKPMGIIAVSRDITDRKRSEEELQRINVFLDSIVENIPDMIFLKDAGELRFVRFNRAGEELLGHSRDDLLGKSDYDLFPKEQAGFFTEKDRDVLRGKKVVDIPEEPIQTRNKGERIIHTKKVPILNANGEPEYLLGISEDITERKKAEEDLKKTLESLRKAVGATIQT